MLQIRAVCGFCCCLESWFSSTHQSYTQPHLPYGLIRTFLKLCSALLGQSSPNAIPDISSHPLKWLFLMENYKC